MNNFIKSAALASMPVMAEAQGNSRGNNPLNCPPGLAKKNPPCVPPGLARQGVTTQDYLGYDDGEWDDITADNPELADDGDRDDAADQRPTGALSDAEIAEVFDLDPPASGNTYRVIDGQVVELSAEDALILDQVKLISTPVASGNDIGVVPDVTLSEDQLIAIYDLPAPAPGTNYAVIDGEIYAVPDATYGLLNIIQVAAGV